MKTILLVAGLFFTANSFAQTKDIKLKNGQTINVTTSVSQNMDMGGGMTMSSSSNSTHVIKVNGESGSNYNVSATLTKVVSNTSAMGQDTKYDSEDIAGSNSDIAAAFEKTLNVTENSLLDKSTGVAKSANPKEAVEAEDADNDLLKNMMSGGGSNDNSGIISNAFFTQIAGKKVGDTWTDSATVTGFKNVSNYTISAINGDIVTINLEGTLNGTQEVETQGMQIEITMNTLNKGTVEVNKNSYQVIKRIVDSEITSTMDMMGQTMDMSGNVKTVTEYK